MPASRRRTIVGFATIVFGASGFVASGAVDIGSLGSRGDNWIQVAGVDSQIQRVNDEEQLSVDPSDGDGGDGSDGGDGGDGGDGDDSGDGSDGDDGGNSGDGGDGGDGDDGGNSGDGGGDNDDSNGDGGDDSGQSTRIQVVTDPDNVGNLVNARPSLRWEGRISESDLVVSDDDGFLAGVAVERANRNAVSRVGLVNEEGYPRDRIAFLIANTGSPETPGEGGFPIDLHTDLYDENGDPLEPTDQIDFPYRVVDNGELISQGVDLLDEAVQVSVADIVEVVVEIDSRSGTDDVTRVDQLRFSASGGTS